MFTDNQVALELSDDDRAIAYPSIAIFSLDDVGFHCNQCIAQLATGRMLSQVLLFGASVRTSDNRFSEAMLNATYSAITLGFMNMTTDNQATHCLLVLPHGSSLVVDERNTILVAAIHPRICIGFGRLLGDFGTKLVAKGVQ